MTDAEIKQHILQGQQAARMLAERYRVRLEGFLLDRCDRRDEASRNRAVVIASEVVEDCFVKEPSLLEQWRSEENLWPFLSRVSMNRLKDWWDKNDILREAVRPGAGGDDDSGGIDEIAGASQRNDGHEEGSMARDCLAHGLSLTEQKAPEGLLFLRMKGLHGVEQRRIALVWGHHESQTARRIQAAMQEIRNGAEEHARSIGGVFAYHDLERHADLLLGGTGDGAEISPELQKQLRELAAGHAPAALRDQLTRRLLANPAALQYLAHLLNRTSQTSAVVVRDPAVAAASPRLRECVLRSAEALPPNEVRSLLDHACLRLLQIQLHEAGADGGTLWLISPDRSSLEAVANPLEPNLVGMRQPLKSGVISLVLGSEEPLLISHTAAHAKYSPAIDHKTGQQTRTMVAVPFRWCGAVRGVLSMVRFGDRPFGESDLQLAQRAAEVLALFLEMNLQRKILGWDKAPKA